jgi:hypothetical protein
MDNQVKYKSSEANSEGLYTVLILVDGEYSDYFNDGYIYTKEDAEELAAEFNNMEIER